MHLPNVGKNKSKKSANKDFVISLFADLAGSFLEAFIYLYRDPVFGIYHTFLFSSYGKRGQF